MSFKNKLNPLEIESKWQEIWKNNNTYKWDSDQPRENIFSIDTPPPTVSGELHMGHIFSYTQVDFIARFQRMLGKSVFYPIGFDNNGLPTERLVEKIKKIKIAELKREDFIAVCKKSILHIEDNFRNTYKSLGISFDWSQEYQTINDKSRKLSQMSFIDLYKKDKITRKFGPSFWDIKDRTAISQAEIIDKECSGVLYTIKFRSTNNQDVIISTTRPELMASCVAVFYHPSDSRYQHLKNAEAIIPFFGHKVPVLTDTDVKEDKGTGLVMCCTFGDIQDIDWWKRYKLNTIESINSKGRMKNASFINGLSIKNAREVIVEKLKIEGLLLNQVVVRQNIKCSERSGATLEIIPTYQWYVKILPYKEQLHEKNQECNWKPKFMRERLKNWISGLNQDWCISRQRYFGVPFPVWYSKREGEEGKVLLANIDNLPVDPSVSLPKGYTKEEVTPETDVMDTWATSAITPQLSSHGISKNFMLDEERHKKLFPYDLRPQGHEIIRTWTFTTLVKSFFHQNSIPWKNLMISGWCLAPDKSKMSKSKGNIVTPRKLLQEYGADVIRYWASSSKLGADINYDEKIFTIGKKFITKLWNAGKFVELHIKTLKEKEGVLRDDLIQKNIFCDLDLWIISMLYKVVEHSTKYLNNYEYYDARVIIENFFWKDFCNNYLELIKKRVYDQDDQSAKKRDSAILTLNYVFCTLLKLLSPYIPHVTEEISFILGEKNNKTIKEIKLWPKIEEFCYYTNSVNVAESVLNILELVRKYKSTHEFSLKSKVSKIIFSGYLINSSALIDLQNTCNCDSMEYVESIMEPTLESDCGKYSIIVQ